jgi:hypothetical protein
MATYAAGATVERRYPGPNAEAARAEAEGQIRAFVNSGFSIQSERWEEDQASGGAPIGDAIASGTLSQLVGGGGSLVIVYVANAPADLPSDIPAYTLEDPRRASLQSWSQLQILLACVFGFIFILFFLSVMSQMSSMNSNFMGGGQQFP